MNFARQTEDAGASRVVTILSPSTRLVGLIAIANDEPTGRRLLTSVRLVPPHASGDLTAIKGELCRQTANLQMKIAGLDRLRLSRTTYSTNFLAARIFIVGQSGVTDSDVWAFARSLVQLAKDETGIPIIAQLDYDQRRLHPELGGALDSIDFQTKHDPSALATAVCFKTVLKYQGVADGEASWLIKGAGDLGQRIVNSVAREAHSVHVWERLDDRRAAATRLANVHPTTEDEWPSLPVHAAVFSADAGSLSLATAQRLVQNSSLVATGGPEAALDRDQDALRLLADHGVTFVPSVLCGSYGLVANLDEILGVVQRPEHAERRLGHIVSSILAIAAESRLPFHEVCMQFMRGERDA